MNPNYAYTTRRRAPLKPLLLIGGLIVAIIATVLLVVSLSNSEPTQQMQRLSARLTALKTIVELGDKGLQNGDLRKINSDASILVANEQATLDEYFAALGVAKPDKNITALEADTATVESLNDAKLNGRLDSAYPTALSQKLDSTIALMREIRSKTKRAALIDQLEKSETVLASVLDQLAQQ